MQWMPGQPVLRAQVLETALVVMVVQVQLWLLVAWVLLVRELPKDGPPDPQLELLRAWPLLHGPLVALVVWVQGPVMGQGLLIVRLAQWQVL